jgi:hypothetical protein
MAASNPHDHTVGGFKVLLNPVLSAINANYSQRQTTPHHTHVEAFKALARITVSLSIAAR